MVETFRAKLSKLKLKIGTSRPQTEILYGASFEIEEFGLRAWHCKEARLDK